MNLGLKIEDRCQPMHYFVELTKTAQAWRNCISQNKEIDELIGNPNDRPVQLGQLLKIKGHPVKNPNVSTEFNLICSDDTPGKQWYIGFGFAGSEKGIFQELVEINNFAEDRIETIESLKSTNSEGFNFEQAQEFKLELIQDLIDLPDEEVNMEYVKNHS